MTSAGRSAHEFARIAVEFSDQPSLAETVDTVLSHARAAVRADYASIMLLTRRGRQVEIAGTIDEVAAASDELQVKLRQGPCLDAARTNAETSFITDTLIETRWPVWSKRIAADYGIRTVISVQLGLPSARVGALNLYAVAAGRFDPGDAEAAGVLARHAAIALARSRREVDLWRAIDTRKLIGQAQGMLMERYELTEDQSFDVLRRYSQDYNVKLHEVARRLVDTRQLPGSPDGTGAFGRS